MQIRILHKIPRRIAYLLLQNFGDRRTHFFGLKGPSKIFFLIFQLLITWIDREFYSEQLLFLNNVTKIISWWAISLQSLEKAENAWEQTPFTFFDIFGFRSMKSQQFYCQIEIYINFRIEWYIYLFQISVTVEPLFWVKGTIEIFFWFFHFLKTPIDREFNSEQLLFLHYVAETISWWVIHLQS